MNLIVNLVWLVLHSLPQTFGSTGVGTFDSPVLATTLSPTALAVLISQTTASNVNKKEVRHAQTDAIQYMQEFSEGRAGAISPNLQRAVEIVAELPEVQQFSELEIIHAIALAQLD